MVALEIIGRILVVVGVLATVFGLWCAVGGLRVVVSRRIDERQKGSRSARFAVPFVIGGIVVLMLGIWLAR